MYRTSSLASVASLAVASLLFAANAADASNRFGVTGITNETKATITFLWKDGTNAFKKYTLAPGQRMLISFRYTTANANKSPKLYVRFDADSTGANYSQNYLLKRYAAPDSTWAFAKQYAFRYDNSTRFLDLVSIN